MNTHIVIREYGIERELTAASITGIRSVITIIETPIIKNVMESECVLFLRTQVENLF